MPVRITTVFTLVLIHDLDHPLRVHVFVDAGGIVDVIVHVDDVELRPGDLVRGHVQHGDGMKIPQQKRLLLLGVGGGFVADLVPASAGGSRSEPCGRASTEKKQQLPVPVASPSQSSQSRLLSL